MASIDEENSSASNDLTATTSNNSNSSSSVSMQPQNPLLKASMLRPSAFSLTSSSFGSAAPAMSTLPSINAPATDTPRVTGGDEPKTDTEKVQINPFAKSVETEDDSTESGDIRDTLSSPKALADPLNLLSRNGGLPKSNLFSAASAKPISNDSGFVFGKNVQDRVTGNAVKPDGSDTESKKSDDDGEEGASNGDLMFSSVFNKEKKDDPEAAVSKETNSVASKSLTEVAREYEESRSRKRKFEEVETFTGEEDETNVLNINCKLFTFVASVYEERGRGSLRVNDPKDGDSNSSSRVVFRAAGSLRVLLNTKIWEGMVVERPSGKSLRLTAIDSSGLVKVYLVMSRPNDINCLHGALQKRIQQEKAKTDDSAKEVPEIRLNGAEITSNNNTTTTPLDDDADDLEGTGDDDEAVPSKKPAPETPADTAMENTETWD